MNATQIYRRTPKGVLTNLYSKMKDRNIKKGFGKLDFSLKDLHKKYLEDKEFLRIYQRWADGGYETKLKPSFDRMNPTLGYTIENIKVVPWFENRRKGDWENSFIYTTPVVMFDMNGNKIREFGSTKEACFATGIRQSGITLCCQGKRKKAGGYVFKYRGDKFRFKKSRPENADLLKETEVTE